ncbi:MAG TPA: sulfite exporter TauE/SafE family protein, partial [Polyangiaceae bacterium]
ILAAIIGLALGTLGGGGSVLAVPLLIYVAGLPDKTAIATSLLVVAATSAVAALVHARAGNVRWRGALMFTPAAMFGAYLGGRLSRYVPGSLLIGLFSAMMLATAWAMWRGRREQDGASAAQSKNLAYIMALGLLVGVITGLVGAGGGFLVVPALALMVGMPMRAAIGTSLVVIAANSTAALLGYVSHVALDYHVAVLIALSASIGALVGSKLATRIAAGLLRKGFSILILIMGTLLLVRALRAAMA